MLATTQFYSLTYFNLFIEIEGIKAGEFNRILKEGANRKKAISLKIYHTCFKQYYSNFQRVLFIKRNYLSENIF